MSKTKPIVDCYDRNTQEYLGSFAQTNENIINYVASIPPYKNILLVDFGTDDTVLTTIGNFLDYVPDQKWLKTILPQLIEKQTGKLAIEKVNIFDRYEDAMKK
ncbi:hypothetical protein ACLSY4_17660 [Enterococcus gallinarum]|uniref:hypothetical protein n=1 Tax=Enterococcus gallinarum TaxID=1353 RepID=UPI003BF87AE8